MKQDIRPRDEDGKRHGYWEVYYSNGQLWYKGYFIRNNIYGYFEQYFEDGSIMTKGVCVNNNHKGYFHNNRVYYYSNKRIKVFRTYKDKFIL